MRLIPGQLLLFVLFVQSTMGQDTLPRFSAVAKANGKIIISWRNNYPNISQISIQRSKDSLKNFTTLLTVPDPTIPENGFVDSRSMGPEMYYRLFILVENSRYIFSKSKRAIPEANAPVSKSELAEEESNIQKVANQRIFDIQDNSNRQRPNVVLPNKINEPPPIEVGRNIYIKQKDSVIGQLPGRMVQSFRDSILNKTKDTLVFVNADTILIKPFIAKEVYKISVFVFAAKDGNININLPDAKRKKYSVKFFEQDNTALMEIKDIKDAQLVLDKANFVHAGWFRFELYEDGKLKEKNRLFIPRDF